MPLVPCSKCGRQVADDANSCPNCGSTSIKRLKDNKTRINRYLWGGSAVVVLLVVLYFVWPADGLFPKNEFSEGQGSSQN